MTTTRKSLLFRLRDRGDSHAWGEFYTIYAPLLFRYARARGLAEGDAEEIRDQCLEVIVRRMPDFEYDRKRGRFKGWLYRIAAGRIVDAHRRRRERRAETGELLGIPDPQPHPDEVWQQEWRQGHLRVAIEQARRQVRESDFEVFEMLLENRPVSEVCAALSINANQVYKAKGRVLRHVREAMIRWDA